MLAIACAAVTGCASNGKFFSSKWAMDNEQYAKEYSAPYSSNTLRKWTRMGQ